MRYIVTGANGGMGRAICLALCGQGHEVIGLDINVPEESAGVRYLRADVTDENSVAQAVEAACESGGIDGVIHAAGVYALGSLVEMGESGFLRAFNVNLFGVYRVNRLVRPYLNENARIVIISSELAPLDPLPFTGLYAITKAALEKYAYSLRMELQLSGCGVSVIRPGAVKTGMLPDSVKALERFCGETRLYPVNAKRFRAIVEKIEARSVAPQKIANKAVRALESKRPRLVYCVNRNPLLLLLNALPHRAQLFVIRKVLS